MDNVKVCIKLVVALFCFVIFFAGHRKTQTPLATLRPKHLYFVIHYVILVILDRAVFIGVYLGEHNNVRHGQNRLGKISWILLVGQR